MQSDYLWVRHAPVEEGVKVRYIYTKEEITAILSCMIELQMGLKDSKWPTGFYFIIQIYWKTVWLGTWKIQTRKEKQW